MKKDGTVVAVGTNEYGQCNVAEWSDIVDVTAGCNHTLGITKQGAVVAVGNNYYNQCEVSALTE